MKNSFASGLKKMFFVVISILSMITSFLFFIEIFTIGSSVSAGDTWGIATTLITGLVGVLILDGAALVWLKTYLSASDNNDVRSLAAVGAAVGFVGSALSSFAYMVLVASNDVVVDPSWSQYVTYAMAVILVTHFALVFLSQYKSTHAQIEERTSEMMARATNEMLKLMEQDFMDRIPDLAKINAEQLSRQITQQFATLTVFDAKKKLPPHPNGAASKNGASPARMEATAVTGKPALITDTPYMVQQYDESRKVWKTRVSYPDMDTARWTARTWADESNGRDMFRVVHEGKVIYNTQGDNIFLSRNGRGAR